MPLQYPFANDTARYVEEAMNFLAENGLGQMARRGPDADREQRLCRSVDDDDVGIEQRHVVQHRGRDMLDAQVEREISRGISHSFNNPCFDGHRFSV
jgi:hypothetical protein